MERDHIKIQFKRLKKHYDDSLRGFDEVILLDLTHTLRVWCEMAKDVDKLVIEEDLQVIFKDYQKVNKIKDILKGSSFIHIPSASAPEILETQVAGLTFIDRALTEEEVKKTFEAGPPKAVDKKMTFRQWLGAEAIERATKEGVRVGISRLILIKRVANLLGASHPKGKEDKDIHENKFDEHIIALNEINVIDGYPVAYYQIIEYAKVIIDNFEKVFI